MAEGKPVMAKGAPKSQIVELPAPERLESWKEIAAYLKRPVRTVQRWEKTAGMPVHRHSSEKVGTVYAQRAELDAWFNSGRPRLEQQETARVATRRRGWVAAAAASVLTLAGGLWLWLPRPLPPPGMVARQVWAGAGVDPSGAPFPDGRHLSFVDWETGDLAVRDLAAGQSRRLTNKGSWADSDEWAERSVVSPDGRLIAYAWANTDHSYELRLLAAGGGQPRVLFRNEELFWIGPAGWSPDGKQIVALFSGRDGASQIALISTADGSVRSLKSLEWRFPEKISLSPDGSYVAYDAPTRPDSADRDIWLLATGAAGESVLVQHPADDYAPVWSPDGSKVLFVSDRTGATGIWAVAVADGKVRGAPQLVKANVGRISPLGFSRQGSYYYGLNTATEDIYAAEVDLAKGKVLRSPERVTERFLGSNSAPAWSPDGRQLAYLSRRGHAMNQPGSLTIVIRSLESGEERDLATRLNLSAPMQWFPDGRSLLVSARDHQGRWSFYRVDSQSGSVVLIGQGSASPGGSQPALSPDGKAIFYLRGDRKARRNSLLARGIQDGRDKELYWVAPPAGLASPVVSPDGRQVAFGVSDVDAGVYLMPAGGGEARKILGAPTVHSAGRLAWTPQGRHLLVVLGPPRQKELFRVPVDGGEPQKIDLPGSVAFPSVHPDGRRLAYTGGRAGQNEIWVLENFLRSQR